MSINPETVKISYSTIICTEHTSIVGDVTLGIKNVVHPTARIIAENGPIVIGDYNLIEENVTIHNQSGSPMTIGNHNVFEVGSTSRSPHIGDMNVLEAKCELGSLTKLTSGCVIGAKCRVNYEETLGENTVIFGANCQRRIQHERPSNQIAQIEFLGKVLPNYQRIEKPNFRLPTTLQSPTSPTQS